MGDLKVDFAALQGAAGDIKTGAGQIQSKLDDMDSQLQPLRSDWTGSASEAYVQAKQQWTTAINDMKSLLDSIGQAVNSSHDDYNTTETNNAHRWG